MRVALYRFFVEGASAPSIDELAAAAGISQEEALGALRRLAADDVIAFRPGTEELWLVHPFCAIEAPFDVTDGRRRWKAICIWDALGILAVVGSDGSVSTACPDCGQRLNVEVASGRVVGPTDAVVHFGVPARHWYDDIGYT